MILLRHEGRAYQVIEEGDGYQIIVPAILPEMPRPAQPWWRRLLILVGRRRHPRKV